MSTPDFVGSDPGSEDEKCPAVFADEAGFYFQGKTVTDPVTLDSLGEHISVGDDESVVWLPGSMAPSIAEAVTGMYDKGRTGPGLPTFAELLANTKRSAVHLEMRDTYDPATPAFVDWLNGGSGRSDRSRWVGLVTSAVQRGVTIRRLRVVSEPVSEYTRWLHMVTDVNVDAGEDVRWLPRRQAYDLMLPGADLWMFDHRLVRFNFNAGDGTDLGEMYEFTADPRRVGQVVAAFEMAWGRAIPHADYKP
jgi:hypothetical protein